MNENLTPKLCECGCGQPTWIATKTSTKRGWIKGQAVRWKRGHAPVGRPQRPFESFWQPEDRGYRTPCWVFLGGLNQDGYGCVNRDGYTSAHRYAWFKRNGPIPDGLEIDHLCRVRCCVNPDHLELVTRGENIRRGSNSRLSLDDVRAIIAALKRGESKASLARKYGVTDGSIYAILRGDSWKEVPR